MSKYAPISPFKLLIHGSTNGWNKELTEWLNTNNLAAIIDCKMRLQVGMAEDAKKKLNTDEVNQLFGRLIHSLDITARKIIYKLEPNPLDDPIVAREMKNKEPVKYKQFYRMKKLRQKHIEFYKKKTSY